MAAFDSSPTASVVEMVGDARQRRVAAVLEPPDERPQLLQVLACLRARGPRIS